MKKIGLVIFVIAAIAIIYFLLPFGIGLLLGQIASFFPVIQQRVELYPFLLYRPELFVFLAAKAGWLFLEVFFTFWFFTTFMTVITWWGTSIGEKAVKKSGLFREKLQALSSAWVTKLFLRYGKYAIFIPFIFPVIPLSDMAAVIAGKVFRVKYAFWIFIGINAAKGLIIFALF